MARRRNNVVFADTFYYLALLHEGDEAHQRAIEFTDQFDGQLLTSAWVLVELGNAFSRGRARSAFLSLLEGLQTDTRVEIIPPEQLHLKKALELFAQRLDKNWSLTDCLSFVIRLRLDSRAGSTGSGIVS